MNASQARRPVHPARVAAAATLLLVVLSLVAASHFYLARRLVIEPEVPDPMRGLLLGALALLGAAFVVGPVAERFLGDPWRRILCFVSYAWMGVLWIALVVLGATEAVAWLLGAASAEGQGPVLRAVLAAGVIFLATAAALRSGLGPPRLVRVPIHVESWPRALEGLRIVQISDIHIGPLLGRGFARKLADRVNALRPDLVAVTGDLVDGTVERVGPLVEPLADLDAPYGVYFVTGNHDVYSGDVAWVARVKELGWRVLRNERVTLGSGDDVFDLAGVDDHRGDWSRGSTEDLDAALADRPEGRPVILLAHDPSTFKRASQAGVDLQISGHTHGGQIWPFRWLVRVAVPFVAGLYRRGRSQVYVSRGTGFWGPPMRLLAPAEITELSIHRAD